MRHSILLLIGLVIGACAGFVVARTLSLRDAYARGTMAVMQHHLGALRAAQRAGTCTDTASFARIGLLSTDIAASRPGLAARDAHFVDLARALDRKAADAGATAPRDCADFGERLRGVAEICDDCHRDYR